MHIGCMSRIGRVILIAVQRLERGNPAAPKFARESVGLVPSVAAIVSTISVGQFQLPGLLYMATLLTTVLCIS